MDRVRTGIEGLDDLLHGGIIQNNGFLLEGAPGTGKTTLGIQFIYNGITKYYEPGIIVTFEELPEQIYHDAMAFGWDLRRLEQENKLRVICTSPEVILDQTMASGGMLEQLVAETGARRILIDSVSLFELVSEDRYNIRARFYAFRNALKRMGLTAIFTKEVTKDILAGEIPYEEYIVDGVIRLYFQEMEGDYRERYIEILKSRGSSFSSGKYVFRLNDKGVQALASLQENNLSMYNDNGPRIPTGITRLDEILGGGILHGTTFILDTNSKAKYEFFNAAMIANRIMVGEGVIILPSSLNSFHDLSRLLALWDIDLQQVAREDRCILIDFYDRPAPPALKSHVLTVKGLPNSEYRQLVDDKIYRKISSDEGKWFMYLDLNTILVEQGEAYVRETFAERVAFVKANNLSYVALCNFTEMGPVMSSFLERTASGVIRTWVGGRYQYLQVTKSPNCRVSEPLIVEYLNEKPYVRLR